jgi:hypothetical protein
MAVSQYDWFPWKQLNIWGRFSLFMFVLIVLLILLVALHEYLSLEGLLEAFRNQHDTLPTGSASTHFPLNFIIP